MKIRLKGRRISGNDPVTFKNPGGDPIFLKDIGSESQEIDAKVAHEIAGKYGDIIEVVETKMQKPYENKAVKAQDLKTKTKDEQPLSPPDVA